jgi:hypothetical protein
MAKKSTITWFVEQNGTRRGPFTLEEIQAKLTAGEILGSHRTFKNKEDVAGLTIHELIKQNTDPVYSLFDTLQVARSKSVLLAKRDSFSEQPPLVTWKVRLFLGAALIGILGALFWKSSEKNQNSLSNTPGAYPPPPQSDSAPPPAHPAPQNAGSQLANPPTPARPAPPQESPGFNPPPPPTSEELRESDRQEDRSPDSLSPVDSRSDPPPEEPVQNFQPDPESN